MLRAFDRLKASGNSLFVVEHELDVIRRADWIVDVGPGAGAHGGQIVYSGPPEGLARVEASRTRPYLFSEAKRDDKPKRTADRWLKLRGVTRNNLEALYVEILLVVFTSVAGIFGSGKSTLISQFLVGAVSAALGQRTEALEAEEPEDAVETLGGEITEGLER